MPVHADTPEPLKTALEHMEQLVQSFKRDLPFKAPEQHDGCYGQLQMDLADVLVVLYDDARREPEPGERG